MSTQVGWKDGDVDALAIASFIVLVAALGTWLISTTPNTTTQTEETFVIVLGTLLLVFALGLAFDVAREGWA